MCFEAISLISYSCALLECKMVTIPSYFVTSQEQPIPPLLELSGFTTMSPFPLTTILYLLLPLLTFIPHSGFPVMSHPAFSAHIFFYKIFLPHWKFFHPAFRLFLNLIIFELLMLTVSPVFIRVSVSVSGLTCAIRFLVTDFLLSFQPVWISLR